MLQDEVTEFGAVEPDFALIELSTGLGCTTDHRGLRALHRGTPVDVIFALVL